MTPRYTPLPEKRRASFPNLNYTEMRKVCSAKPSQLARKYGLVEQQTPGGKAWFKDNGASVLAVAHLDSRLSFLHFDVARLKPDTLIYCPTLDDRLGAYVILDWLSSAGIKVDILLTENEEKGMSTAGDFQFPKGKKYNWMFSFDRTGTDVVTYNYRSVLTTAMLEKHGWKVGNGSYSCIADLEDLGCKGFNFGTAYYEYHSEYAWASRNELMQSLRRFYSFYSEYANVEMPHVQQTSYFARDRHQGHLPFHEYKLMEEKDATPIIERYSQEAQCQIYPLNTHKGSEDKNPVEILREQAKIRLREKAKAKVTEDLKTGKERLDDLDKRLAVLSDANKRAISTLLMQDIGLAGFNSETEKALRNNNIHLFAELVCISKIQCLNLPGVSKAHVENIEKELKKYVLGFSTKLADYGIDMQIITNTITNTIRKEIINSITNDKISTSEKIKPEVEEKPQAETKLKMIPMALPLEGPSPKPTEKSKGVSQNDAEIVMICLERYTKTALKLVPENGKLVWKEKVPFGFVPAPSSSKIVL